MNIIEPLVVYFYRISVLRRLLLPVLKFLCRKKLDASSLRHIFDLYHDIGIGKYTYGGCFDHLKIAPGTIIGRYCSIASGVYIMSTNHNISYMTTHPFLFKPYLGFAEQDNRDVKPVKVGNDVWIGTNAIILPSTSSIGDGAVVAAGAVVTNSVPPYAVVAGVPAKVIRYRFSPEIMTLLLESQWWYWSEDKVFENWRSFMDEDKFRELLGSSELNKFTEREK